MIKFLNISVLSPTIKIFYTRYKVMFLISTKCEKAGFSYLLALVFCGSVSVEKYVK
jgi:hypothetical protein